MRYLPSFFDLAKLWVADRIGLRRLFSATSYLLVRQLNADTLPEGPEGNRHLQDSFLKLFRTLQPDIFLDIGANDGSASLTVRRVAPTCQIHAFEANPRIYEKNREKLQGSDIRYWNLAVSDRVGPCAVYAPLTLSRAFVEGEVV